MDLVSIQHPGGVTELTLDGRLNMVTAAREAGGDLVLVNPTEQVVLVLDLTNMNATLRSFTSVAEAYPHG